MSNDPNQPTRLDRLFDFLRSFQLRFEQMLLIGATITAAVSFVLWRSFSTDAPAAVLEWSGLVVASLLIITVIDIHKRVKQMNPGKSMGKDDCRIRILQTLDAINAFKLTSRKPINIDVIGIALSHSHVWISEDLADFLSRNKSARIELKLVFVDPDHIKAFGFIGEPGRHNWERQCRDRLEWVNSRLQQMVKDFPGQLKVYVRLIDNLPHWHGVLIERRHLFLGRIGWSAPRLFLGRLSWEDGSDRWKEAPTQLTCASNGYREYELSDSRGGGDRIRLFRKWIAHYCFGNHQGKPLFTNMS